MPDVTVTIDGVTGSVPAGSTVIEAAQKLGVNSIPTLCHHPAIEPIGACRICLVEIEKQRALQPACTFPVADGMVVHTMSDKAIESRKFVLQLLFSERNHFCMFCQMSGSCELQDLAYAYGLDHWEFDRAFPKLATDASREFFIYDPNRCILCRRCIRVCDEVVGNGTLGLRNRGTDSMIVADLDVPFGESSCVSCGTCLQVCPTGALIDRESAYMGATAEVTRVKSRCTACGVGCGIEIIVRDNRVIRIEGDWDAEPNKGLLCERGRFGNLYEKRQRIYQPIVGGDATTADAALAIAAQGLKAAGDGLCTVLSGYVTNEEADAALAMPGKAALLSVADGAAERKPLSALDQADGFCIVKTDLAKVAPVASYAIKRAFRHRQAPVATVDVISDSMDVWTDKAFAADDLAGVAAVLKNCVAPAVVFDDRYAELAEKVAAAIPNATLVPLALGGNTVGLLDKGVEPTADSASAYYVLAGETAELCPELEKKLAAADFVVVQACYAEPWSKVADVILPAPVMYEKNGTFVNTEGKTETLVAAIETSLVSELETIKQLAELM